MPVSFYLDDSDRVRTAEHPGLGIFGMGGIIVASNALPALEADIDALVHDSFREPTEIKWHMPRSTIAKLRSGRTQRSVREEMFRIMADHACTSIVTLIYDVRRENSPVGRDTMRSYAFEACLQRLHIRVGRSRDPGPHVVVVDTPPESPKQLHAKYAKAYRNPNVLPSGMRTPPGKECGFASALQISDATHCLALQAADSAVGCVVSWAKAELANLKTKGADTKGLAYGREYMAQWLKIAARGPRGVVLGYGLARWPREINLLNIALDVGLEAVGKGKAAFPRCP